MKAGSIVSLMLLSMSFCAPLSARISESQRQQVDRILGAKGIYTPSEDTYRVTFPRTDVRVTIGNRAIAPFMGLASWVAMTSDPHHGGALLSAEFALFEDEINPVLSVALGNGLEVMALHNEFLFERPRVLFMDISSFGEPPELAAKARQILDKIKAIRRANTKPTSTFEGGPPLTKSNITASMLDSVLETRGQSYDGMYRASMGMRGLLHGILVGKKMGVGTWIAFSGTDERAVVDGEIVMTQDQVQGVLRALEGAGLKVVAVHNHMIDDHPEFVFVHYWGQGRAVELARGVRAALETQLR